MAKQELDEFLKGYVDAAVWAGTDQQGEPLESNYCTEDITARALAEAREECEKFCKQNTGDLVAYCEHMLVTIPAGDRPMEWAGHDFWLTRNGHGAGFWDRGLHELGDRLVKEAKLWPERSLLETDDGNLIFQ